MHNVVNTLAPIFLVIALGTALRAGGFLTLDSFKQMNRLVYWVGMPCLLVAKTAQPVSGGEGAQALRISLVLIIGMLACLAAGFVVVWTLRIKGPARGALLQGAFRGNLAYVGLSVILFSYDGHADADRISKLAMLSITPLIVLYNIVSVLVLEASSRKKSGAGTTWRTLLLNMVTNPLILACAVGVSWSFTGWQLPALIGRSLDTVGKIALPLALLAIGAALSLRAVKGAAARTVIATLIKIALAPLVGYFAGHALGLKPEDLRLALIFLACPTAVMSYIMAEQLGADDRLAGSIVVISTLASVVSLGVVLAWA